MIVPDVPQDPQPTKPRPQEPVGAPPLPAGGVSLLPPNGTPITPPPGVQTLPEAYRAPFQQEPMPADWNALSPQEQARIEFEREQRQRDQSFLTQFRQSLKTDPNARAEAQAIAAALGRPTEAIENDLPTARELMRQRAMESRKLKELHPALYDRMQRDEFLVLAHDDVDALTATSSAFGWLSRQFTAGRNTNERGYLGAKIAMGKATEQDSQRLAEIDTQLGSVANDRGMGAMALQILGQMSQTLPATIAAGAAGALTGPAAPVVSPLLAGGTAFAQSAQIEGGNAYLDMIAQGYDHDAASAAALGIGIINGALEVAGLKVAAKPFQKIVARAAMDKLTDGLKQQTAGAALSTFIKDYGKTLAAETGVEAAQEVTNILGDEVARLSRPDLPSRFSSPQGRTEMAGQVWDAAAGAFAGMLPLAGVGPGARFLSDVSRAGAAQKRAEFFAQQNRNTEASNLAKRAPGEFADTVNAIAPEGAKTVYVDGKTFADVLNQEDRDATTSGQVVRRPAVEQLDQLIPGIKEQVQAADRDGGDVAIPIGDYQTFVARTGIGEKLQPHVKLDPEDMTLAEAEQVKASAKDFAEAARKAAEGADATAQQIRTEAATIRDTIATELQAATRNLNAEQRRVTAQLYADFAVVQAQRMGMTPAEWQAKHGVQVRKAGDVAQAVYEQADPASPEFRNWFGASKVVDAQGKPLVVYHGTGAEMFDTFDPEGKTERPGFGHGSHFAENPDIANFYSEQWKDGNRQDPRGERSYPVYLRISNPYTGNFYDENEVLKNASDAVVKQYIEDRKTLKYARAATNALKAQGFDGIRYKHGEIGKAKGNTTAWVALYPTQIKSVNNRGTFDPNDPNILRQGGSRGTYHPPTRTITLGEKTDASTFLHELAHHYLHTLGQAAAQPEATAQVRGDMQTLLDWFGVKDLAAWDALGFDGQEKYHERLAYSFESWLFDGKAPSIELDGVFRRIVAWMRRAYETIKTEINAIYREQFGEDLPALTPEVRGVFERMLASDAEIEHAITVRGWMPAFADRAQFPGTDAEWEAHQEALFKQREDASDDLTRQSLREMRWLGNARKGKLRELQKEHDAARAKVRSEVEAEVKAQPVYRIGDYLRTGKMRNEDGTDAQGDADENHKLDSEKVAAVLGEKGLPGLTRKGGLDPDLFEEQVAAGQFGSGEAMLRALADAPPMEQVIEQQTDARMMAEHSELADPAKRERAVEKALHGEARARFVAAELRALSKATQPTRILIQAARATARAMLDKMKVGDIRPRTFAVAEAKAAREANKALKNGNSTAAAEWKRRELLHGQLVALATEARESLDAAREEFARFGKADTKLAKSRNLDLVNVGRAILSHFGLGTAGNALRSAEELRKIAEYDPELFAQWAPLVADAEAMGTNWKALTLEQFGDLRETLIELWDKAGTDMEMEVEGRRVKKAEAVAALLDAGRATMGDAKPVRIVQEEDRKAIRWAGTVAKLKRIEHTLRKADGGQAGAFTRYIWRPVREAVDNYFAARESIVKQAHEAFMAIRGTLSDAKIDATQELGDGAVFNGTKQLLGALYHSGNRSGKDSNLRKLLVGYGWAGVDNEGVVDATGWDRFVARMVREGKLTKAHFDFIQKLWDLNESTKADAQRVNKEAFGRYFKEVQADSFSIAFPDGQVISYRGGYAPATPDPDLNADIGQRAPLDALTNWDQHMQQVVGVGKGFTQSRTNVTRPLLLDVSMAVQHLDDVLRFIHLSKPVREVAGLLRNRDLAGYLNGVDKSFVPMMIEWLRRSGNNSVTVPSGNALLDSFFGFLRRSAGLSFMFGNIRNAMQNATGLLNARTQVQGKFLRAAMVRRLTDRDGSRQAAAEASKFMANKLDSELGQFQDDIKLVLDPKFTEKVQNWSNRYGYFMQRVTQNEVDLVVWHGAHDQALAKGLEPAEAVKEADAVVRMTQGSNAAVDVASYEVGSPMWRAFVQFSSYFNAVLNQITMQPTTAARVKAAMLAMSLPALGSAIIASLISGGDEFDDEDGDGVTDEALQWFVGGQIKGALGMVPVFGSGAAQLITSQRSAGDRIVPAPFWSVVQSGARVYGYAESAITKGELPPMTWARGRDFATVLATATGFPIPVAAVSQVADFAGLSDK